jgi:hypothetical protein
MHSPPPADASVFLRPAAAADAQPGGAGRDNLWSKRITSANCFIRLGFPQEHIGLLESWDRHATGPFCKRKMYAHLGPGDAQPLEIQVAAQNVGREGHAGSWILRCVAPARARTTA